MKPESKSSEKGNKRIYQLIIKDKAVKQLSMIPAKFAEKIDILIQSLAVDPRPLNCKKLQGYESVYRVRLADYRVLYTIADEKLTVEVIQIGNRKDVYNKL
jgi:mRNA interferase RelE/StbE